jgi:hypothetical protein
MALSCYITILSKLVRPLPVPPSISEAVLKKTEGRAIAARGAQTMARHSLRGVAFALAASAAIATAHGAKKNVLVLGWEVARWGMDESEISRVFSSRVLVPLAVARSGETALNIPGYVFLGCPFDVSFRFVDGGLVRIELTQVEKLASHYSNNPNEYETACKLVDRRLEDKFGPAQSRGADKVWTLASGNVRSGKWQTSYAYITFAKQPIAQEY